MGYRKVGKSSWRFECEVNGKRFSKNFQFYNATKKEIEGEFIKWKVACGTGAFTNVKMTYEELANIWINEQCATYSPVVIKNYQRILNNWVLPECAKIPLNEISALFVTRFVEKLKNSTSKYAHRENELLSNGTIKKIYEVFRSVIALAYRNDIIDKDPCTKVRLNLRKEIVGNEEIHYWDIKEYTRALELLKLENVEKALVIEMALKTGLRRSELFGLTWSDIVDNQLYVNKTRQLVNGEMLVMPCKTQSSIRRIIIPDSLVKSLKAHHKRNMNTTYVFENIGFDSITAWFRDWVKAKRLSKIKFHDLRHTHATLLLSQGIDVKTIQKRLGHSNISTTLNTYTHVLDELDQNAAKALEKISI